MVWPFLHCFPAHANTRVWETWLRSCFSLRRAYIVCRAEGGLWCNQYQISAVSLWALILSGRLDWLLTAYAIPLLSSSFRTHSITHYSLLICLVCLILHSFTFSPVFASSSGFHSSLHLSPPIIITSVIALPLPGGDVFTAAFLSNPPMPDYCRMITATIPSWSLLHSVCQCSTLYEQIEMLYPI